MSKILAILVLAAAFAWPQLTLAHSPIFDCSDNGDGTISCEGGFSDGSSASGVAIHVQDASGKAIEELKLDKNSEITFKKPSQAYKVTFDAGAGHQVTKDGKDIVQ
ncbi:MAG: hypothetical protein IJT59_03730 [Desulfovibrionaceae bacterium]|nr:hypothetical protein [Desulfovibrionaceae bacterium]